MRLLVFLPLITNYLSPVPSDLCRRFRGQLCAHVCTSTPTSYHCSCRNSFKLMSDGRSCKKLIAGNLLIFNQHYFRHCLKVTKKLCLDHIFLPSQSLMYIHPLTISCFQLQWTRVTPPLYSVSTVVWLWILLLYVYVERGSHFKSTGEHVQVR